MESKEGLKKEIIAKADTADANYILVVQALICVTVLLLVMISKQIYPKGYLSAKALFSEMSESTINFSMDLENFRCTNGRLTLNKERCGQDSSEYEHFGAGGWMPAQKPKVPEGYSLKSYQTDLQIPVEHFNITSRYGWRKHPVSGKSDFHTGIDLAAAQGEKVYCAAKGIVVKTAFNPSYGNYIVVMHDGGNATKYCHLQFSFVHMGDVVDTESLLGTIGSTGVATGPHLHFELLYNNIGYNPEDSLGLS